MRKITFLVVFFTFFIVKAQDTCSTALSVVAGEYVVDVVNGNHVPTPGCISNSTGSASAGEWYVYTASENLLVTVSTDLQVNSGKDTRIHIYSGDCSNLSCIVGDDDSGAGYLSIATFFAQQGQTYYIAFDNRWSSLGFTFQVTEQEYTAPLLSFIPTQITMSGQNQNCVVDMNGDYLDDLVAVSNGNIYIAYQNSSGGFTHATIPVPNTSYMPTWSIAAGDIDGNGYNDLLYGGGNGVTFMIANQDGTAYSSTVSNQYIFSQRTNFVDINNDGNLDAFICHDVQPNVYYLNDGNNNLLFNQGGIGDYVSGGNYGSIWFDYNNDGHVDLFISKCRGGHVNGANINELHRNNGDGTFTNVAPSIGMDDPVQTWSSAVGDFDNDGFMDILIGASSFATGGHLLKKNNGNGTFTDVTLDSGFDTYNGLSYEYIAHDFDNDGFIDIIGPGGTIFLNNGDFTFTLVETPMNEGPIGDLNNDGFLDIRNGNLIYFNQPNENNWLKVTLEGVESNRNGIGARVEIHGDWGIQIRDVMSGTGFAFMSTINTHFGIGTATNIEQVVVKWPSGTVDIINNPDINATLHLVEGASMSINSNQKESLKIYPNPVKDILNINSSVTDFESVKIFDVLGKLVFDSKIINNEIDVHNLSKGIYILVLKSEEGAYFTEKFIKN